MLQTFEISGSWDVKLMHRRGRDAPPGKRILFCCPHPVSPRLGASKVYIEAAEGFRGCGWQASVVGPEQFCGGTLGEVTNSEPAHLREYLRRHAADFDVVEYEHNRLPYPREDFPPGPLFVARSVLLTHQVARSRIPPVPTLRGRAARLVKGWLTRRRWQRAVADAERTLRAADLINVCNAADRDLLLQYGHPAERILLFPFGLFASRLAELAPTPDDLPCPPVVGFVGTFDPRKGMCDLPAFAKALSRVQPGVQFLLLGTAGLVRTAEEVVGFFPPAVRPRLHVLPHFAPAELPGLLRRCSLGVFPSYCEGFPFGVLEMLAAGLPVVGFDAPGPPEMLPPAYLVPPGDADGLALRVAELLADADGLRTARRWARRRAEGLRWEAVAARTAAAYLAHLAGSVPAAAAPAGEPGR
jgi:glycosyltransferase involved in cell wall biosynthesis